MGTSRRACQARRPTMKNFVQLSGNFEIINVLNTTLVSAICGFDNAYEFEDLDDQAMIRIYPENIPAANFNVLLTSLYYRLQDAMYAEVKCNVEIPEPAEDVFRVTASVKNAQKVAEDFFIYNGIENYIELVYPLSADGSLSKIEIIAIGLSEEEQSLLNKQGKTAVMANKVHNKIEKVGNTLHNTGRIVANDVVNPLAVAAAKTTATIVSAGAKTLVDCGLAAANEILRDAAQLSVSELKQRKEVQTMGYSLRKIMNKTKSAKSTNKTNNFNF